MTTRTPKIYFDRGDPFRQDISTANSRRHLVLFRLSITYKLLSRHYDNETFLLCDRHLDPVKTSEICHRKIHKSSVEICKGKMCNGSTLLGYPVHDTLPTLITVIDIISIDILW